jgi:Helix-turn-helix domain
MESTLLTPVEAAQVLGLSPATLATWRCLRKGPPYVKLGGRVGYQRDSLASWRATSLQFVDPSRPEARA